MRQDRVVVERPQSTIRVGSRRHRILDYIADQGGELRSESGQGLRRQICDALGERPTSVSQALTALEKAGLLERELDVGRRRCHAIRLLTTRPPHSATGPGRPGPAHSPPPGPVDPLTDPRPRLRAELEAAQHELNEAIRRAAEASRRVHRLRWGLRDR
jgi:DNA-binding transcriptional ArsR family regulator